MCLRLQRAAMDVLLLKLIFLEFPAVLILLHWRRRGVASRFLYGASWTLVGGYVAWLGTTWELDRLSEYSTYDWMYRSSIPVFVFLAWPFFSVVAAIVFIFWAAGAKKGERAFMACSNVLMLVLWANSFVAPN